MIQFCTFYLGDFLIGIEVSRVREVVRNEEMTDVPLTHGGIAGLINIRGQVVTAIDLREQFGIEEATGRSMNVVLRTEESPVSVLVSKIGDVVEADEEAIEKVPETTTPEVAEIVEGVCKLDGRLLLILDTSVVVEKFAVAS